MGNLNLLYKALSEHNIPCPPYAPPYGRYIRWGHNKRYWARAIDDGYVFGNWANGTYRTTFPNKKLSKTEYRKLQQEIRSTQKELYNIQETEYIEASRRANNIWNNASLITKDNHPYLNKKQVQSYELKVSKGMELIIPLRDTDNKIWSLQFIDITGNKRFLYGGKAKGCFHIVGAPLEHSVDNNNIIYICEGYATGATIYKATKGFVVVVFSAGNLFYVAQAIQEKYLGKQTIICADNDAYKEVNVGLEKAKEAGGTLGIPVIFPVFKDVASNPTDFNDLYSLEGIDAVNKQIDSAINFIMENQYAQQR
jgi:putative DNA primase/helicase